MTQEGQALPSPTPPENPVEPNTAASTSDPLADTCPHTQADALVAQASEDVEKSKQEEEEENREGEEKKAHGEGEGRAGKEGEGNVKEKKLDSSGGERQQTEVRAEEENEGTRGDRCADMVVISTSTGEEAVNGEVEKMEGGEEQDEVEEGKDNEETHTPAEDPHQAERWVYYIIFIYCCSLKMYGAFR